VARDERGKGFFGVLLRVLPQQSDVVQFVHLHLNAADWRKVTVFFARSMTMLVAPHRPSGTRNRVHVTCLAAGVIELSPPCVRAAGRDKAALIKAARLSVLEIARFT
jgi:hypothetical protein